jgi:outer membrane protein
MRESIPRRERSLLLRGLVIAAGLSLLAAPAHAEVFAREQAIQYALEHNPDLLGMREQAAAAGSRRDAARGAQLPQLGLNLSASSSNNALDAFAGRLNTRSVTAQDFDPARLNNPGYRELYLGQLGLRWSLYTGGRVSAQAEGAAEMAKAAQLEFERARELTAFYCLQAYLNVQLAEQGLIIAEDAVGSATQHADTTARLAREGRIVSSDKLTAEVNLAAMQSARAQARTRLERARHQLARVMGLPPLVEPSVTPYPGSSVSMPPQPAEPATLEQTALARRKDLAAAQAVQLAARSQVDAARAAHLPQVDLVATHNRFDNGDANDSSNSVMGVVALDLYSGGQASAGVSAAAAEAKRAEWQVQARTQSVRQEVGDAYQALREARERHEIATGNVERARETVRQVQLRYGQGRTILIDLLQAERALVEARNEELGARLSLEVSQAALALAQGAFTPPGEPQP